MQPAHKDEQMATRPELCQFGQTEELLFKQPVSRVFNFGHPKLTPIRAHSAQVGGQHLFEHLPLGGEDQPELLGQLEPLAELHPRFDHGASKGTLAVTINMADTSSRNINIIINSTESNTY